jgi:D-alanyl-D-alanine carboxypeptidase
MTDRERARTTRRPSPAILVAGLFVVVAAAAASLGSPLRSSDASSLPAASSPPVTAASPAASRMPIPSRREPGVTPGEADGAIPDGTTVFDDEVPGVAHLDPDLRAALRRAAADASGDGVEIFVTSGWRSRTYQERLFRQAIAKDGSAEGAARWVAAPGTSVHESGDAVDIGHADATAWLARHGSRYGLCQVYRNEPWHYELRAKASLHGCPPMYADPTHDPRLER